MAKATKSIVGGMTVLGVTGIVCKLVGVLFSVPLTMLIGADGLGVFQSVFPTYNLLLTISPPDCRSRSPAWSPIAWQRTTPATRIGCSRRPCGCCSRWGASAPF